MRPDIAAAPMLRGRSPPNVSESILMSWDERSARENERQRDEQPWHASGPGNRLESGGHAAQALLRGGVVGRRYFFFPALVESLWRPAMALAPLRSSRRVLHAGGLGVLAASFASVLAAVAVRIGGGAGGRHAKMLSSTAG